MITAAIEAIAGLSLRTKIETACVVLAAAGAGLWWVTRPPGPIPENTAPAPMVRQADQSVIAERKPDPYPKLAPHKIPAGYVEERRESVHVAPDPAKTDVQIDLSLVRKGDERRVIASTPDGTIVSAVDIPIEPAMIPPPPLKWAAGMSYSSDRQTGVWLEHDIGRLRLGAEVSKGAGKPRAEIRVGVAF